MHVVSTIKNMTSTKVDWIGFDVEVLSLSTLCLKLIFVGRRTI